jgi:hypothetical protein
MMKKMKNFEKVDSSCKKANRDLKNEIKIKVIYGKDFWLFPNLSTRMIRNTSFSRIFNIQTVKKMS